MLGLETGTDGVKKLMKIAQSPSNTGTRVKHLVHSTTEGQMGRLFNSLPYEIQKIIGMKKDTFKKEIDKWLKGIPDTPRVGGYAAKVFAPSNSIVDQRNNWRLATL